MYRYQFIFVRQLHAIEINVGNCKNKKLFNKSNSRFCSEQFLEHNFCCGVLKLKLKNLKKLQDDDYRAIADVLCVTNLYYM